MGPHSAVSGSMSTPEMPSRDVFGGSGHGSSSGMDDSLSSFSCSKHGADPQDPTEVPTRRGAYSVVKVTPPGSVTYEISVPAECGPGDEFDVQAGNRKAEITVPDDYVPGDPLEIELPPDSVTTFEPLRPASLTASPAAEAAWKKQELQCPTTRPQQTHRRSGSIGGAMPMMGSVRQINEAALRSGKSVARTHVVTIPPNVRAGQTFQVTVEGVTFQVPCPGNAAPGQRIRIVPPPPPPERHRAVQFFQIQVPPGVQPGQQFAATVGAHEKLQVLVECPRNAMEGQTIQVQLPTQTVVGKIELKYESHKLSGWRRTVRASDLRFQWVRVNKTVARRTSMVTESIDSFHFLKSAYVRQFIHLEGNDPRLGTASVRLVPANVAVTDSKFCAAGKTFVSYSDIARQQVRPLAEKHEWFTGICRDLMKLHSKAAVTAIPKDTGDTLNDAYIEIFVRRENLLVDSVRGVMSLTVAQMRAPWRIRFLGEPALDDGGLSKEWFQCVSEKLLDPATGLFVGRSDNNQALVDIHPGSFTCQDAHLMYYRFAGRVIGRALFSNHQIHGHLVRTLYKHLLGWPVTYEDVRDQDEEIYTQLLNVAKMEDVSQLLLCFTATERILGEMKEVNLCEGGCSMDVTNDNLAEYLEAFLRYRTFDRALPQLTELLLGFYDVVPEPALTVFDASELELILCGLPTIDVEDWKANTDYTGLFETNGSNEPVVEWFWEVVEDIFDMEMRARLLQFATGTSSVPPAGFASLGGFNGKPQRFTIEGVDLETCLYPKAHTCFNRIDCPRYATKEELIERLMVSITTSFIGFDDE